ACRTTWTPRSPSLSSAVCRRRMCGRSSCARECTAGSRPTRPEPRTARISNPCEPFRRCRTLHGMDDDDAAVWRRVLAGEESALAALFDRHSARLFRHARRLLTAREDAKDAVTIAFFELW